MPIWVHKLVAMTVVILLAVTALADEAQAKDTTSLTDIQGHWAEESILNAVEKGYVSGYPDETFKPNNPVTRAEFIKMLVDALELPTSIEGGPWYQPYVEAAEAEGIFVPSDFSSNEFNKDIPREEMVKVAVRALEEKSVEEREWMYRVAKRGIIHGTAPGELSPEGFTTRAQAIVVIERILNVKNGGDIPIDKYAVSAAEIYWHRTNIFTVAADMFNRPENDKSQGRVGMRSWKEENFVFETADGKYKAEIDQLVVIDMADPNDPNRALLPPIRELIWSSITTSRELDNISDDYIFLLTTNLIYNNDPSLYSDNLKLLLRGFEDSVEASTTNAPRRLLHNGQVIEAYIVSKKEIVVDKNRALRVYATAPGYPGASHLQKRLINSYFFSDQ